MLDKKIGGIEMSKRVAGEGTIYFDKSMKRFVGQFPYKDLETGKTKRKKGRLQVQIEQDLSSNYISGIHLIKKSVEQFIRSVVA